MQIAIPVWRGRVSPLFDSAHKLVLVRIENGNRMEQNELIFANMLPLHRVQRLVNIGVDVLICGAISRSISAMCLSSGITVLAWVSGPLEEIIQTFLQGRLPNPAYTMPGCCKKRLRTNQAAGNRVKRYRQRRRRSAKELKCIDTEKKELE